MFAVQLQFVYSDPVGRTVAVAMEENPIGEVKLLRSVARKCVS
jgi:hypothetical protein